MRIKYVWLFYCLGLVRSLPLRFRDANSPEGPLHAKMQPRLVAESVANIGPRGILWVENTGEFIVGVIMVVVSMTASWFFERQLARLECLVSIGRNSCVSVPDAEVRPENFGQLVHLSGRALRPEASIQDPRFSCSKLGNSCTRLRTQVQAFQCDGVATKWSEEISGKESSPSMPVGTTISNSSSVRYGANFSLPDGLLDQCTDFRSATKLLGSEVCSRDGQMRFQQHKDGFFYWRTGAETSWTALQVAQEPRAGDLRARFEVIFAGSATILALQVASDSQGEATLLPYRLVPLLPFGDEKQLRVQEARKSRIGLALEDQVCPDSCLCFSCNFVAGCCTGVATPEIFRLFEGNRPLEACFADLRKNCNLDVGLGTWTFRLLVLSILVAGIYMSFSEAFLHLYPVMNSVKSSSARFTTSLCAALAMTSTIIGVVFFPYKIGKSCIYFTVAIFFLLFPIILMC